MPIRCEIVSQDRQVFSGNADIVVLPGSAGVMGVLPNHSPLLTTLQYGVITVRTSGHESYFTVAGGIAEVQPDQVTVLADAAENVDEIDVERAEAARTRAEALLKQELPEDTDTYLALQSSLRKSNLRLDAVRRYKKKQDRP
jgi:F-type H+-transporting ATPase subunit epsilon